MIDWQAEREWDTRMTRTYIYRNSETERGKGHPHTHTRTLARWQIVRDRARKRKIVWRQEKGPLINCIFCEFEWQKLCQNYRQLFSICNYSSVLLRLWENFEATDNDCWYFLYIGPYWGILVNWKYYTNYPTWTSHTWICHAPTSTRIDTLIRLYQT